MCVGLLKRKGNIMCSSFLNRNKISRDWDKLCIDTVLWTVSATIQEQKTRCLFTRDAQYWIGICLIDSEPLKSIPSKNGRQFQLELWAWRLCIFLHEKINIRNWKFANLDHCLSASISFSVRERFIFGMKQSAYDRCMPIRFHENTQRKIFVCFVVVHF